MVTRRLVEARIKKHWSQKEAAEKLGCNVTTLSRWETGKVVPNAYNIRQMCDVYEATSAELGLDSDEDMVHVLPSSEIADLPFIQGDLTIRLMALAYTIHRDYQVLQDSLVAIIEECTMQNNELHQINRREALNRLAALPLLSFGLSSTTSSQKAQRNIPDTLNQCAAGIAACRELSKGNNANDLLLASRAVSAYLPTLEAIMKESLQHRKTAANLAAQASRIKAALARIGWQGENLHQAAQYAQDAVKYAGEAGDQALLISSLISSAWVHYYNNDASNGVKAIGAAVPLLKQSSVPKSLVVRVLSTQAVMEAKNNRGGLASLKRAHQATHSLNGSDYYAFSEGMIPEMIGNEAMTHYHDGDYDQAMDTFSQIINPENGVAKMPLSGKGRTEMLNLMAMSTLKAPKKDMDLTINLWRAGLNGAKNLQSKQRFNESVAIYDAMESVWSDAKIKDLRDLLVW